MLSWGLIFFSALLDSYAAYVVKYKFNELGEIDFSSFASFFNYVKEFFKSPLLISGIVAFACAPGMWFIALNKIDLSIGYPVLVCFHLVFVLISGIILLGEEMNLNKIIGSILILASLYFFYKQ